MDNSKQSKQILLSVIGVAILVVAVVGVSFAFFNYTRTGAENTVSTGKIKFVSEQDGSITISNVFPLTSEQLATEIAKTTEGNAAYDANYVPNFAEVVVAIKGETTYSQGLDYRVTAAAVDFETNATGTGATNVSLPVNVTVTAANLGTAVDTLSGNTDQVKVYSYTSSTPLANGNPLAEGHIAADTTAQAESFNGQRVNGTLTIRAYLDSGRLAITDTYAGAGNEATDQNGTTDTWVNGRTVITTDQWNSLASSPLSFKVKVESKETGGTYVGE